MTLNRWSGYEVSYFEALISVFKKSIYKSLVNRLHDPVENNKRLSKYSFNRQLSKFSICRLMSFGRDSLIIIHNFSLLSSHITLGTSIVK